MAKNRNRRPLDDLPFEARPDAPLDTELFLAAARMTLVRLKEDLLSRVEATSSVNAAIARRHAVERESGRTAASLPEFRDQLIAQVAAAWLLSCVFVRTLEDRGLIQNRIAGPGADDSQRLFVELAPSLSERDYLILVFREVARLPAGAGLFAPDALVFKLRPSADAARELLGLFRRPLTAAPAFRFGQPETRFLGDLHQDLDEEARKRVSRWRETRFLGDLYQDLDEEARKRFALLQTPDFIEQFILDRTLERAVARFGLADTTLIDPTGGSGHFLLGAFDRLFEHHQRSAPGLDTRQAAVRALDAIYGCDLNPYAVAIARFRLTLAYVAKAGHRRLADAPCLPIHLVCADSLLHNPQHPQPEMHQLPGQSAAVWAGETFALEDDEAARDVLHRQYAAVVGNPPYITVKDAARRDAYRRLYTAAFRTFSLAAPFAERFFQLARPGGFVGQITANSFMKREFGRPLVENVLSKRNLDLVVNTSGAFIPGHGTPTVLLFGTAEAPQAPIVRTVLARRGEPSTPSDPSRGVVWTSARDHWEEAGFENDYVSVADISRATLAKHPWSLGGGGAAELKELLEERAGARLNEIVDAIGFSVITGEDNCLVAPCDALGRKGVLLEHRRRLVLGEEIRDWGIAVGDYAVWPNDEVGNRLEEGRIPDVLRFLWAYRQVLKGRKAFGVPVERKGIPWWSLREVYKERMRAGLTVAFAFVATHNHFVIDRGGIVFNRTAPIIKLPDTASEDEHLVLLAYLNSSTACFWMKQVFHDKGSGTDSGKWQDDPAKIAYEFTGTGLEDLPVPSFSTGARQALVGFARDACRIAAERGRLAADGAARIARAAISEHARLRAAIEARDNELLAELVGIQEEIDWMTYAAFSLAEVGPYTPSPMSVGARPFEGALARQGITTGIDGQPLRNMDAASPVTNARIEAISTSSDLAIIETPTYKRRWAVTPKDMGGRVLTLEDRLRDACQSLLEDWVERRLEGLTVLPRLVVRRALLAEGAVAGELANLASWLGSDSATKLSEALSRKAVPYLAVLRFKPSGQAKHAAWERAWAAQREEDAGRRPDHVPLPPRYAKEDYTDVRFWELRGKLDVPKECFISYPGCESDQDEEPVYGWAGWNHLERARALAELYQERKQNEGWGKERLTPMLAGLLELVPWLRQWHNEPDAEYHGLRMGEYFTDLVDSECRELGLTHDDLRAWRPEKKKAARQRPGRKAQMKTGASEPDVRAEKRRATAAKAAATRKRRRAETAEEVPE